MHSTNPNSSKGKLIGTNGDPLTQQSPNKGKQLSDEQITDLYKSNRIFQNIIDIPAEDMTRAWINIEADKKLKKQIENKLNELDAQPKIQDMCKYERLRGDGFCSIGARNQGTTDLEQDLEEVDLIDIDYIHAFSRLKVNTADINNDLFSKDYGNIEYYELQSPDNSDTGARRVHRSRIIHHQVRTVEDEIFAIPLIQSLYDPLMIFDNAAWSVGQLVYSLVFKVLSSKDIDISNNEERTKVQAQLEHEFNSLTLALIGEDDSLEFKSPTGSLSALKDIFEFVWDYLAGSARMPKAHILGQQQGTITGGQFDSLNYYSRISGLQENYLRPLIEHLINLLFKAKDSGVGQGIIEDPQDMYKLHFNPLWNLDRETDAEIRKTIAKTDEIYIKNQVVSPDEVKEQRFGEKGLMEKLDMSDLSDEEIKELAKKVDKARREYQKNEGT